MRRVIAALADADLSQSMSGHFQGAFAELQQNVNSTMVTLRSTMQNVRGAAGTIKESSAELSSAADDLSKRTEQQAAALEETAAALDEITATVRSRLRARRRSPRHGAPRPRTSAGKSGEVVRNAVERHEPDRGLVAARSARSSASSTRSPSRPTCWRSTPASKRPAPAKPARASPSSPRKCAHWPSARPMPPRRSRR